MKFIKWLLPVAFGITLFAIPSLQSVSNAQNALLAMLTTSENSGDSATKPHKHKPLLKAGLHPKASDALRRVDVKVDRIMQTVGGAPDSNGIHLADGQAKGKPYTAAVDLSTRGLNKTEVRRLLEKLGREGFAAWYRNPGNDGWLTGIEHIHAVYAGVPMKVELDDQIRDYLRQRNGLSSHTTYEFYRWSDQAKKKVAHMFKKSN
jgi:hypothetical protein